MTLLVPKQIWFRDYKIRWSVNLYWCFHLQFIKTENLYVKHNFILKTTAFFINFVSYWSCFRNLGIEFCHRSLSIFSTSKSLNVCCFKFVRGFSLSLFSYVCHVSIWIFWLNVFKLSSPCLRFLSNLLHFKMSKKSLLFSFYFISYCYTIFVFQRTDVIILKKYRAPLLATSFRYLLSAVILTHFHRAVAISVKLTATFLSAKAKRNSALSVGRCANIRHSAILTHFIRAVSIGVTSSGPNAEYCTFVEIMVSALQVVAPADHPIAPIPRMDNGCESNQCIASYKQWKNTIHVTDEWLKPELHTCM